MKNLRCMAYPQDGVFVAACLDLSLAAQGDSLQDAKRKLESQIHDYFDTVLSLPDRNQALRLLTNRKAPLSMWVKYWFIFVVTKTPIRQSDSAKLFTEPCKPLA